MFEALTLDDLVIRSSSHTPFFGVYLATHAVVDGLCMCHASVGCKVKTQQHLVGHDGIKDAHTRMRYSQFIDEDLINGSTVQLEDEIRAWHKRQSPGLVVIDGSTPISLQGMSMSGVIERMEKETGAHVVFVDSRNYDADYFVGYADTMGTILKRLDWSSAKKAADEVSIVGHLFDRYEPDSQGNVSELRRLLFALGFKAKAVFFAGEKYAALKDVVNARTHIVLPHAHSQTKVLTGLKQDALETGLPMSIAGTRAWIEQVGRRLGVDARAKAFVDHETERLKPMLELARKELSGRTFALFADGSRAAGLIATLTEVGMVPAFVGTLHLTGGKRADVERDLKSHYGVELPAALPWIENPTPVQVKGAPLEGVDIVIGPTVEREHWGRPTPPWIEFGFPSTGRHYLFPAPSLGFNGAVHFLEEVMHALPPNRTRR